MPRSNASPAAAGIQRIVERGRALAHRHRWTGANLAIPLAMLAYAALVALLCQIFGRGTDFRPDLYLIPFYVSYVLYVGMLTTLLVARKRRGQTGQPRIFFIGGWGPADLIQRLTGAAPFLLAWPVFMSGFTAMKTLLNDLVPFSWDIRLMEFGKELHFGQHPWRWLAIENPVITQVLEAAYAFWGVLLVAVPFAVALRRHDCALRTRFLVSYLLVLILLGNVAAGTFMSAGPFWFEFTKSPINDYAGLFSYLMQADPNGEFSAVAFQRYLWQMHQHGTTELGTGISAFPSIHVAAATLYVLLAWPFGRIACIASLVYLALIMVGAVHLGWHYSIDCYAGGVGAVAIYASVGAVQRFRTRPASTEPQPAPA